MANNIAGYNDSDITTPAKLVSVTSSGLKTALDVNILNPSAAASTVAISGLVNLGSQWSGIGSVYLTNSLTTTVSNIGANFASMPTSGGLVGGNYLGSFYPFRIDTGSYLMVAGSISSMPSISATNPSVIANNSAGPGSSTIIGALRNGSTVSLFASAANELLTLGSMQITNSFIPTSGTVNVLQSTSPWITLGSVNINNASAIGSLTTQNVSVTAGSIQTYSPLGIGSVYNINNGSVAYIPAGSVIITNTITANPNTAYNKLFTFGSIAQSAAGTTTIASAVAGSKHRLMGAFLTLSSSGTVMFSDSLKNLTGAMSVAQQGGFVLPTSLIPYCETGSNANLNIITTTGSAAGAFTIITEGV